MERRTFLAAATLPFWSAAREPQTDGPRRTSRVVGRLRPVSQQRRDALDQNPGKLTPAALNRQLPEIDDLELGNGAAANASPRKTLRLIAWNTERGRHWRKGVQLIQESPALRDPDFVFLGEMDLGMARSANEHTTREMAAALGMNYVYGVEFLELTGGELEERELYPGPNDWGYHGNAILSRYLLRDLRMVRFPGIEKWYDGKAHGASESEWPQKRLGGRMALFATVRLGRDVTIVSAHLESSTKDSAIRKRQIGMILDELRAHAAGTPVIVGGDFNAVPGEPMFEDVRAAGFRVEDTNAVTGGTTQKIVDGKVVVGDKYIDYLLVRGLRVVRDETSPKVIPAAYPPGETGTLLADHAIVTAKVEAPWM